MHADLDSLKAWAERRRVTVLVGEFGAYQDAPMRARAARSTAVRRTLERPDFGWCYWDFATDFGA